MGCSLMASVEFGKEVVKTMHMLKEKGAKSQLRSKCQTGNAEGAGGNGSCETGLQEANIFMPGVSELKMITGEENLENAIKKGV